MDVKGGGVSKSITFLISSLSGGGMEGVCVNVANGLSRKGWKVNLIVLHLNRSVHHKNLHKDITLVVLGVNQAKFSFFSLLKYFVKNKPEKVVVFNFELAVIMVLLRTILFYNFSLIARSGNALGKRFQAANTFKEKYIFTPLVKMFYAKVDRIICQCEGMKDDLLSLFPELKNKVSVIYNPVNTQVEQFANKLDFTTITKQDYLLCVGRLEKQKAFHYAIEAFAQVSPDFPNLRLKIIGKGSLEGELKQLAKNLNIASKVDFEGFQSDISGYYLNATATVLTSLYEGFPNVLVESITCGTPVIAFDCESGPAEIIESGKNGFLIEYQNTNELTKKMLCLIEQPLNRVVVYQTSKRFNNNKIINEWERFLLEAKAD